MVVGDGVVVGPAGTGGHEPVLPVETLELLHPMPGQVFVDATVGLGGHAGLVLERLQPGGRLIGLDRDAEALAIARERLARFGESVTLAQARFDRLDPTLAELGVGEVDGVLFDLGVSSYQLDRAERGFSFSRPGPLDMRMDPSTGRTAAELVAAAEESELAEIFYRYGEERWARRIALRIVEERQRKPIERTDQLAEIVARAVPRKAWPPNVHPATRVFQALRIAVNEELDQVGPAIRSAVERLKSGGRVGVIAFHSLEDRIVKQVFGRLAGACTCPPRLPVCVCGARAVVRIVTRKPVAPGEEEVKRNSRARSARLRVAERM